MAKIETPTAWEGWGFFAALMLVLVGTMQIVQGLGAIANPDFFITNGNQLFVFDIATWGWIHLVLGIVSMVVGSGLFNGSSWARVLAIIIVMISFLAQFAFLTVYPIWSIIIMVIDILVIYALTVHGEEVRYDNR